MKTRTARPAPAVRAGDVVIALFLLAVFVFAYLHAQDWPFRTRFFPEILAAAGIAFAVIKLAGFGLQAHRHRQWVRQAGEEADVRAGEQADEHSIEYVFGTAGGRAWLAALAWVAVFFASLLVFGVFITVPLFTLAYLKIAGSAGWLGSVIYTAVAGGLLWFVFGELLAVPMPAGIF